MTGIDPDRQARRLRWAAGQLGLAADASPEEVRAAWLRLLPEEGFVPFSEWRWALAALLRREPERALEARADEAAAQEEEDSLRDEVEAFAEQFWGLLVEERRQRWGELSARCAFAPALRARLRLLGPGLGVAHWPQKAEETARLVELAGHLRDLFVLRPEARARARQSLLGRMEEEGREWHEAGRRLRRDYPELAALGKDLLEGLAHLAPAGQRQAPAPPLAPAEPGPAFTPKPVPRWIFWVVLVAALAAFRILAGMGDKSPSSSPPPPPATPATPAVKPWFQGKPLRDRDLQEFIKEIERKEKDKVITGTKVKPGEKSP